MFVCGLKGLGTRLFKSIVYRLVIRSSCIVVYHMQYIAKKRTSHVKAGLATKHDSSVLLKKATKAWKVKHYDITM